MKSTATHATKKARRLPTHSREQSIAELAEKLRSGQLTKLPKKLTIDLETVDAPGYQALLELLRYRSFGTRVLQAEPHLPELQRIRSLINGGRFAEALSACRKAESSRDPEIGVETARALLFLGKFSDSLSVLSPLADEASIPSNTRGVIHQMIGHAHMELGSLEQALHSVNLALSLADLSGNLLGRMSAHLFLAKILAFRGDLKMAEFHLGSALADLKENKSFRSLLGYFRHRSHVHYLAGNPICLNEAHAAVLIARALKDELFEYRGILEITLMSRKFGLSEIANPPETMVAFARSSESDLNPWMQIVFSGGNAHTYTAKRFLENAAATSRLAAPLRPQTDPLFWIYDSQEGILIDLPQMQTQELLVHSPLAKILSLVNRSESEIPLPELFEKVWNLRWKPEQHQSVLDMALSRFNRLSPALRLKRSQSQISLPQKGLEISNI